MTSGPSVVMILEKKNGVEGGVGTVAAWRKLMGATDPQKAEPNTLRKLYGKILPLNAVHGSDGIEAAKREMELFFQRKSKKKKQKKQIRNDRQNDKHKGISPK